MKMTGRYAAALMVAAGLAMASPAVALDDGHGPDGWQVIDVAPNDVLNMRMGPGTDYPVIGAFAHDARGLQQITCVPLITFEQSMAMSDAQRAALPPRWCLMTDAAHQSRGWVNARYLAEDGSTPIAAQQSSEEPDGQVSAAEALVRELYSAHALALRGAGPNPLQPPRAQDFFFQGLMVDPGALGADPLYDAQDFEISNLRIAADPDQPVFRGMITIHADFMNFGTPRRATFYLRADTERPGAPIRIFRIEHEDWDIW